MPELGGTVADALLAPHRSYLRAVQPLLAAGLVKGMAHITGGGITENLPRTLPESCGALVERTAWRVPPIFTVIQQRGRVQIDEMFRAFNMGIGLVLVCAAGSRDEIVRQVPDATVIGEVVAGGGVRYR